MKKIYVTFGLALVAGMANADWNLSLGSGWRLTAGGAMNGNIRTRLNSRGPSYTGSIGAPAAGDAKAEAQAKGDAYDSVTQGRVTLPNGGFIDPVDSAGIAGETWNWYMPAGSLDANGTYSFSNPYREVSSVQSYNSVYSGDDDYAAGVNIELSRSVYEGEGWGVDFAFGFNYFQKDDFYKSGGQYYSRTDTVKEGSYNTSVTIDNDVFSDPWSQNADGSWGAGTFGGPGPVLVLNNGGVNITHSWGKETVTPYSSSGSIYTHGDYREIEMLFALKPYYDITDWFRVIGTVGVGVSQAHFDFKSGGSINGQGFSHNQSFDDWACYGVAGLGAMLHYSHVCLGFDFLGRFLQEDIDINGKYVDGYIERAPWMMKVYLGVEF